MEINYKRRTRINVSRTSKGLFSFEATVELYDASNAETLAESNALIADLKKEYPVKKEEG